MRTAEPTLRPRACGRVTKIDNPSDTTCRHSHAKHSRQGSKRVTTPATQVVTTMRNGRP